MRRPFRLLLAVAATLALSGCRCSVGDDSIARGDGSPGHPPNDDEGSVSELEPSAIASDEGALIIADVTKVDVGKDGEPAWGRAHFTVLDVLRGQGLAKGATFTHSYKCERGEGRRPAASWAQCPDRTRHYALWVRPAANGWRVVAGTGRLDAGTTAALSRATKLRVRTSTPAERLRRLADALGDDSVFVRRFARDQLRYSPELARTDAARALLAGARKIAEWDERASMLDAAAERLVGADDEPSDADLEVLQAITRSFVDGATDHARSRGFQTLYHALNPGITDVAVKRKIVAKRLALARRVDPGPDRVIAALRAFDGRGGLTNGERDLIAVLEGGAADAGAQPSQ